MATKPIVPLYPDVLGDITGGICLQMPKVQAAFAISPRRLHLNQPGEMIVLLQNMIDQPLDVLIGLQLPQQDMSGNRVVIAGPKSHSVIHLAPGEVGALHIPFMVLPPTHANIPLTFKASFRYQNVDGSYVRTPIGAEKPSVLSRSTLTYELLSQASYEPYTWSAAMQSVSTTVIIEPHRAFPPSAHIPPQKYTRLWAGEAMQHERELLNSATPEAEQIVELMRFDRVYHPLLAMTEERFAAGGLPLHPGEAQAIAHLLAYTIDGGLSALEREDAHWFRLLCHLATRDAWLHQASPNDLPATHLYDALLYDAIMLGFKMLAPEMDEDLGAKAERINYANRVLLWLGGQEDVDASFAYLPLVMAGVLVHNRVRAMEQRFLFRFAVREAIRGREELLHSAAEAILFRLAKRIMRRTQQSPIRKVMAKQGG